MHSHALVCLNEEVAASVHAYLKNERRHNAAVAQAGLGQPSARDTSAAAVHGLGSSGRARGVGGARGRNVGRVDGGKSREEGLKRA